MKYAILIGDGMADYPIPEYEGRTALQIASTPNLDFIANEGVCGTVRTIPPGMDAGSDIATLSILGYDPARYYTGRGPLEAMGMSITLEEGDIAFRCNLVTESGGRIVDYSGGHISDEEAKELIAALNAELELEEKAGITVTFYPGVSYRNVMVMKVKPNAREGWEREGGAPPHDIIGARVEAELPRSAILRDIILASRRILHNHDINKRRAAENKNRANMVWLWSGGRKPVMPEFRVMYGVSGAVISGVYLVKGVARCVALDVIEVPGATGYIDTNYSGKAEYALRSLKDSESEEALVMVHVEAPDEAAHSGDIEQKVKAIENFDTHVVGRILSGLDSEYSDEGYRILVLPDHYTPVSLKVHTREPVPFAIYDSRAASASDRSGRHHYHHYHHHEVQGGSGFNELAASRSSIRFDAYQQELMHYLFH